MLLCRPSSISTAQRSLPRKSMLLCPSFISPAQRSLPRKACFSVPLPSAPRSGASPKKHASLPLFHQPRAAEPPQKSMLLCPSSISTAQRKLPRKARMRLYPPTSISTAQRSLPKKACFSAPLPSAPRSGGSPEKHASLSRFHQPRAAEAPHRKAYVSTPLPSESRSGGSPEKHTSLLLFHQPRAAEAPQKSTVSPATHPRCLLGTSPYRGSHHHFPIISIKPRCRKGHFPLGGK